MKSNKFRCVCCGWIMLDKSRVCRCCGAIYTKNKDFTGNKKEKKDLYIS